MKSVDYLIVGIFIGTVAWVIALSNKPLKRAQIPKSEKDDKSESSDSSEEIEKEEIK